MAALIKGRPRQTHRAGLYMRSAGRTSPSRIYYAYTLEVIVQYRIPALVSYWSDTDTLNMYSVIFLYFFPSSFVCCCSPSPPPSLPLPSFLLSFSLFSFPSSLIPILLFCLYEAKGQQMPFSKGPLPFITRGLM